MFTREAFCVGGGPRFWETVRKCAKRGVDVGFAAAGGFLRLPTPCAPPPLAVRKRCARTPSLGAQRPGASPPDRTPVHRSQGAHSPASGQPPGRRVPVPLAPRNARPYTAKGRRGASEHPGAPSRTPSRCARTAPVTQGHSPPGGRRENHTPVVSPGPAAGGENRSSPRTTTHPKPRTQDRPETAPTPSPPR